MATKTATVDTGEWIYIDKNGSPHTVTDGQTFTIELTDGGATAVTYSVDQGQSITTTDGYTLVFRPEVDGGNTRRDIHYLADASDAATIHNLGGEISIQCPVTGIIQNWKVSQWISDDVDSPTALSGIKLEDQFGNVMDLPSSGAGITVA